MRKRWTSKVAGAVSLLGLSVVILSCGTGKSAMSGQPLPNIAGAWEFVAVSSNGSFTGIEVALAEGQVLVNGVQQPDGQITASSTQIAFVSLDPKTLDITGFGGDCQPITSVNSLGPGSVAGFGAPISFTFIENGNTFNVTGTLSGDGKSLMNGTYTAESGNICSDSGGSITGVAVSKLSGTYTGKLCPLSVGSCQSSSNFTDDVTATATESSGSVLTLSLALTGTDNTTFTLNGPVTGNAFTVSGTFQGQTITYYGYFELVSNHPSLYLVNATNTQQPSYVGTLALSTM